MTAWGGDLGPEKGRRPFQAYPTMSQGPLNGHWVFNRVKAALIGRCYGDMCAQIAEKGQIQRLPLGVGRAGVLLSNNATLMLG
jgi:hypothetical protein